MKPKYSQPKEATLSPLQLADGLVCPDCVWPTVFIETNGADLRNGDHAATVRVNAAIESALALVHDGPTLGQTLLKVHVGEPLCSTRLRSEFMRGSARFLRSRGASGVVAGDTTVAYSGPRGHKENPPQDVSVYRHLARRNGWGRNGPARVPFVVLDRPCSCADGEFAFDEQERVLCVDGVERFKDFFVADGFASADFIINQPHLTLHGLAGLAGCVKGIAMGGASLRGKLRMHQ